MNFFKLLAIVFTFLALNASAQNSYSLQEGIYKKAAKYGDLSVAKNALYTMMELKPQNTFLLDTLAILYFQSQAYVQSVMVTNEILVKSPSNVSALEIKAISESALGLGKEALGDYEKLYSQSKNVYHLYQIASLQYQLKRMGECELSINKILVDPSVDKQKVSMRVGQRGQQQEVGLKAAAMNMKGVLYKEMAKNELARLQFQEAIKLEPNFVLAKGNLEAIDKIVSKEETNNTVEKQPTKTSSSKKKKK